MLPILPINAILYAFIALIALTLYVAPLFGVDESNANQIVVFLAKSTTMLCFVFSTAVLIGWRWLPISQKLIFPYLGGEWAGTLSYERAENAGVRDISMTINHSVNSIKIMLESEESSSTTLSCSASKDEFEKCMLYYVFLNQRKIGTSGGSDSYKGAAIMHVISEDDITIRIDYFTERSGTGTMELTRTKRRPFWVLWK